MTVEHLHLAYVVIADTKISDETSTCTEILLKRMEYGLPKSHQQLQLPRELELAASNLQGNP